MKLKLIAPEYLEQEAVCQWLTASKINHFAVPNANAMSSLSRDMAVAVMGKLKKSGLKKGVPDLVIFMNKIVFIEMKKTKGGKVSKEQMDWINYINTLPYAKAFICCGAVEAIDTIKKIKKGEI